MILLPLPNFEDSPQETVWATFPPATGHGDSSDADAAEAANVRPEIDRPFCSKYSLSIWWREPFS